MSRVHRFVSNDFTIRAAAVDATAVVREMQSLQDTMPLPTVAVGRAMVGALLMASQLKEGQQVGLYIRGQGLLGRIYAEAHFEGQVRGYTPFPLYVPANYDQGLSLSASIGEGTLSVTRHLPFQKQPHHGNVQLVSGEIGDDIAHYLIQSHQIRSLVSLGVYLDTYGKVKAAGGIIIEVMPGADEAVIDIIEKNAEANKASVSEQILNGHTPEQLIAPYFKGVAFTEIDHPHEVKYFCPCTKDRVVRALETLGLSELQDMIDKKEKAAVTCQICGRPYEVSVDEIEVIKNKLYKESLN